MKISKLLNMILGLSGFVRMGVVGEEGGGLSMADAMASLTGGAPAEQENAAEETDEQLAERLAAEEAGGATQADGESETEEDPKEAAGSDKITIEVDGKLVELSKADLPELYKGNLRQKDYTQKTMQAAETVKVAEAEAAKHRQEREHYARELNNFAITTQSIMADQQKVLTQELLDSDPTEYLRQRHLFEQRQVELNKANGELQRLQTEYQNEQQQENQRFMQAQRDALIAAIPELKDQEKQKSFFGGLDTYLTKSGFKPEDGKMLFDARVVLMADKAQKYEALMARVKESAAKVKAAPVKVERPGTGRIAATDGRTQGMKQLARTGSMDDAAALLRGI